MISCRDLTRRFGQFTAVDSISFEVAKGAICAVLGPNGAGKSTTVAMLTGLLAPTSGEATVCGVNVLADPVALKRRIGVLPEDLALFDDLTVEEHLELTGDIYFGQPRGVRTRVLADPTRPARSVCSSANRRAANLPGMVTDTPTHSGPNPPTTPGSSSAPHSMRS